MLAEKLPNYNVLKALGLDLWHPRDPQLSPEPLIINAKCAALVFNPEPDNEKILTGMLSVLTLNSEDLMLVKIYSTNPDLASIAQRLQVWQAKNVLQLNMQIPAIPGIAKLIRTYSPDFLANNPEYKPQAYKDLLKLKQQLFAE